MGDAIVGAIVAVAVMAALNIVDVTFYVERHVEGRKTAFVCGSAKLAE